MLGIRSIKQHPVLSFYVLTFLISWGGMGLVIVRDGLPGDPAKLARMVPVMIVAMLAGPSVACLVLTGMAQGSAGYRELRARLATWRLGIGWYAAALLTAPLVLTAVPLALALRVPGFVPRIFTEANKGPLLMMALAAGLAAGCCEELGWTGFVIPRLRARWSALGTGVVVGLLWGFWHAPVNLMASSTPSGGLSLPSLLGSLLFSFGLLPAYRILMVWVWDHTGSLLLAMLMHFSLTAGNITLGATAAPGMMAPIFVLALTAGMWIVVALSAFRSPGAL